MTKLEIACVICGIIGFLSPARIKIEQPVDIAQDNITKDMRTQNERHTTNEA